MQTNTINTAQSLGSVQESFRYRFSGKRSTFISGDQFTISEDMPRSKPIRFEIGEGTKDGRTFESKTYLIRVKSKGYEADMEIYGRDLPGLSILCPIDLANFRGATFVFNGNNWAFLGIDAPAQQTRDPRQPDLNPPNSQVDQAKMSIDKLIGDMKTVSKLGITLDAKQMMTIADTITPGHALELITNAKQLGYIIESAGVYRVP